MTQPIDVDRLVGLIEDAAIRYAGGVPVDFRPTAKEIAALVLEEAERAFSDHDKTGRQWVLSIACASCAQLCHRGKALCAARVL